MTPFVSTMDLLNHAYDAYDIYITEREFSKRLNDLCFPATLAIPNGSDIYILFADAFEVIKYEKSRHDPNPLRINGSKISGGLRVRSIKKLPESGIDETVEILEGLFENFKHNLINDPILDTTKDIKSLTSEEFCRAFNIVESIRLHTSIIRMCIQFVSLVIPHESKKYIS